MQHLGAILDWSLDPGPSDLHYSTAQAQMQVRGPSKTLDYASLSYCDGDRGKSDRQCRLLVAAANLQSCYLSLTSRRTAHLRYEQQKMEGAISSVPDGAAQHHIIASLPCGDGDGSMAGSGRRRQEEVISGRRVNRASTRVIQQSSNQPVARQRLPQYQSCQQGSTKCRTCGQPSGTFHTSTQASTGARPIPSSPAPTWLLTLPLPIASQRRLEPTSRARQVKKGCRAVLARADLKKILLTPICAMLSISTWCGLKHSRLCPGNCRSIDCVWLMCLGPKTG